MVSWKSITTRTLIKLGSGMGLLLLLMTCVTHYLVFQEVERRELQHMGFSLGERVERIERQLAEIPKNLYLMRAAFLEAWKGTTSPEQLSAWNEDMVLDPDGAWRARLSPSEVPHERLVLWIKKGVVVDDALKRKLVALRSMCRRFQPGWAHGFRSCYGNNFDGSTITGFDAEMAGFDLPADFDTLRDPTVVGCSQANNPERAIVWTSAHSVGPEYCMVSVVMPVDVGGEHLVNVGHDLLVNNLVTETERGEVGALKHAIVRRDGLMIAGPGLTRAIHAANGQLSMADAEIEGWKKLFPALREHGEEDFTGFDAASGLYYAGRQLTGPGWLYLATLPQAALHSQAFTTTRWVVWTALPAYVLGLVMLGRIMTNNVALPISQLLNATRALAEGRARLGIPVERDDEIGVLASAFERMANRVREEKEGLERRVAERTVKLEAALERQTELVRLKSDFVSMVSHEFRTPLSVILSACQVLERYRARLDEEQSAEHVSMIADNTRRLSRMVDEVLLLARTEQEVQAAQLRELDVVALLTKLVQEANAASQGCVEVKLICKDGLPPAWADELLLCHIMNNLLSNAVKYSENGSMVVVDVEKEGVNLILQIEDAGIGIPEKDQRHLFTSFLRGSNVGDRPGTGLGLVMVQRCVALHGGELDLKSAVGLGTVVRVKLPLFCQPHEQA